METLENKTIAETLLDYLTPAECNKLIKALIKEEERRENNVR